MRLRLQQISKKALAEKKKTHKKLVEEHLSKICNDAASHGSFETPLKFKCLSDGLPLTGKEVKEFVDSFEHPLTYTPPKEGKLATLSWYPESENTDRNIIE